MAEEKFGVEVPKKKGTTEVFNWLRGELEKQIVKKPKKPGQKTALETRKKQGPGFWMGDVD
jgi:hypothetical protein